MKKIVSLLLCMLLLATMSTALADTVVTVNPGDELTLEVSLTSASGDVAKIGIVVSDGAPVTFVSAVGGDVNDTVPPQSFSDYFDVVNINDVTLAPDGTGLSGSLTDYTLSTLVDGKVGTLTFKVNEDATPGTYQVSTKMVIGSSGVDGTITFTVEAASDKLLGDVNGDGVVDGRDSVRLMKYLVDNTVEIVTVNSDMNEDGVIDGRDSIRLMKALLN